MSGVSHMAKNSRDDNRNFIITSKYKHKSTKLSNFVEKEVVDRFESYQFSDTSSQVENRKEARKWLEKVKNTALEAMSNISQYRKDGKNPPEFDALIEEERLKVLHEIGWSYTDNFITRKKSKKDPSDTSTSDPETSFMISTEEIGNVLYYRASYGIVRGVANKSIGNYTYALTLDEAIKFIRREFETAGKTAMSRKLLEAKKRQLKMERSDRRLNTSDLNKEVENELNKVWNPNNINKVIKRVQDSADITTIADFIEFFLAPIARKMHYEAFKHEKELQGAQRIQDKNMVDLDKPSSSVPEDSVVKLKPTTRTNNEGVEEKRFIPVDRDDNPMVDPQVDVKEESVIDESTKENTKPTTVPPVHGTSDRPKKSIKNSERVQVRKPLLPPVPSIPLIGDDKGVDLDETTDQVDENLNIDKDIVSAVEENDVSENTVDNSQDVEATENVEENVSSESDSNETHDSVEVVEENAPDDDLDENDGLEETDSSDKEDINNSEEEIIANEGVEKSGATDSNVDSDQNEEDILEDSSRTDTSDDIKSLEDSTEISDDNESITEETSEDTSNSYENIENTSSEEDNIDENITPALSEALSGEIIDDNDKGVQDEGNVVEKYAPLSSINKTFPEFIDNHEYVVENEENIDNTPVSDIVDNTVIMDDANGSITQELVDDVENDNLPSEEEVRNDFVDEDNVEKHIQEDASHDVDEDDYIQPEEVVEDDEYVSEQEDEDPYIVPVEEIEVEEVEIDPRINDDIIDEFDDFLQDEEELMMRGEEINSALDDFDSDDITSILKDSIPELFDVSRMPVREDDGKAEEINNMMDDFLDFEDELYDEEDEDK